MPRQLLPLLFLASALLTSAAEQTDSVKDLNEVVVTSSRGPLRMSGPFNGRVITATELKRAACCNLGESFTTNPSVDVNYSDAATGARQIRLLGLSGNYVQMLTENTPNFRGAAAPYGLGYIPGPWMQSIQVSKGTSSVKNGYESITGQINVEMKKPQLDPSLSVNLYYDMLNKLEANIDGNLHLGGNWSAGLLTHFENAFSAHDSNSDGFMDTPRIRQYSFMPRIAYLGTSYVFQAAFKYLDEHRQSGQDTHHSIAADASSTPLYQIRMNTRRWEAMTKNAFMFDRDNDGNVALILSASGHNQNAAYGLRICNIDQREVYASLMYERKWNDLHALSAGLSLNFDDYHYGFRLNAVDSAPLQHAAERELVSGAYAQYTLNLTDRLTAMAGVRYDFSSRFHSTFTPRMHLRYRPIEPLSLHASAGKGYRTPHPLAEYSYILASSRQLIIAHNLQRESAENYGLGATYDFTIGSQKFSLDAEYYYTHFTNHLTLNLDRDPHAAYIYTTSTPARSHAVQVELTAHPTSNLTLTLAWRLTDVRERYLTNMQQKPLTSRNKGLLTISYAPMMGLWQFDASLAINGGGRMPTPYITTSGTPSWATTFRPFTGLNAQITRNFRHWAIYIGGENLTNFRQRNPIVDASNPWGPNFDATMIYGPLHGAMAYIGFRYNFTKFL